ncbi:PREDICTED: tankyrase-like protein [Priapulus caudatus]|uniref:Tankyrase-like protein n=1 Tax=Priapulus caudatus TaxID=37621 RepID=A0ABM1EA54_PRICU|nr:PREDICTED: tankyrase-like protein [Priapulus caudatus]XP_014669076.1 PREDICTED: tankyrase-like protein [Priapulus caudatus]XP_014669077.1 PREDICTED: tankyrase-like protein [Priapulus caudatus]XP_014669078.1 PREDICTED: tankyrase-like protein [Priapulus caudatus]
MEAAVLNSNAPTNNGTKPIAQKSAPAARASPIRNAGAKGAKAKAPVAAKTSPVSAKISPKAGRQKASPSTRRKGEKRSVEGDAETPPGRSTKRLRVPHVPFQVPMESPKHTPIKHEPPEEKVLYYAKGKIVAVRNEKGSFYLCQTGQNVYKTTRKFKMAWLSLEQTPNIYKVAYPDQVDQETVLTNVKVDRVARQTFKLPNSEKDRIELILQRAIKLENGQLGDAELAEFKAMQDGTIPIKSRKRKKHKVEEEEEEEEDEADEESDEEDEESEEESGESEEERPKRKPAKQPFRGVKTPGQKKEVVMVKPGRKPGRQKTKVVSTKVKKPAVTEIKKPVKQPPPLQQAKAVKTEVKGRKVTHPNQRLQTNPKVPVYDTDPMFEATTTPTMPFSVSSYSKLAIRAVLVKDTKALRKMVDDTKSVCSMRVSRSIDIKYNALHYAILANNKEAITILLQDLKDPKKRVKPTPSLLKTQEPGKGSHYMLGHATRPIVMSRGGKEGNNALTKDLTGPDRTTGDTYIRFALKQPGVSWETVEHLIAGSGQNAMRMACNNVHEAISAGNRRVASKLMEMMVDKMGGYGFNELHKEVLINDQKDLKTFRAVSIKKKPIDNAGVTPIHCACINPNPKYLAKLLSVQSNLNLADKYHRRPVHYAAACEGKGPLELLLARNVSPFEVDSQQRSPLMVAAYFGRTHNVELLLKKAKSDQSSTSEGTGHGLAGVNQADRRKFTALHVACLKGHLSTVKVLLRYGADVEQPAGPSANRATPLMIACAQGHYELVKYLIEQGAIIEKKDKLKRTPVMHAVMNGHAHVTSLLLNAGASPNNADSSGNTCAHYAAGYSWYDCLQLLIRAGANISAENAWKLTPFAAAFLKGHRELASFLSEQPSVNINCRNDEGMTLVMQACQSALAPDLVEEIFYIVKTKKADCTLVDAHGSNALHHLASQSMKESANAQQQEEGAAVSAKQVCMKIARVLLDNKCDPALVNTLGKTPLTLAVEQGNTALVELLIANGGGNLSAETNADGENALHAMATNCGIMDLAPVLSLLVDSSAAVAEMVKSMAKVRDCKGFTPLLRCCLCYQQFRNWLHGENLAKHQAQIRDMMKALLEVAGSDVNATVETESAMEIVDPNDKKRAVHLLVECTNEEPQLVDGSKRSEPALRLLLSYTPELDVYDGGGSTPLTTAIALLKEDAVKLLLDAGCNPNLLSKRSHEEGMSPLLLAANKHLAVCVKSLVEKGAVLSFDTNRIKL